MPYAPGIDYRGDAYIAQGNIAGWNALATALEGVSADAKKAKALRGALAAYAPPGDEGKAYTDRLQTLGLADLEGESAKQGVRAAQAAQARQTENDNMRNAGTYMEMLARAAGLNRDNATQARLDAGQAAVPGFAADLSAPPDNLVEAPLTPQQQFMRAVARHPAIVNLPGNSLVSQSLARAMAVGGENGETFYKPGQPGWIDPALANDYVVQPLGPKAGQLVPKPSALGAAVAITGPNGENLGVGLRTKNGVTPLKTDEIKPADQYKALSTQLNTLIGAQSRAANPTIAAAYQAQIDDVGQQLHGLAAGNKPAASGPPAITTKAQFDKLPSGTVYTGQNGKQYRKP